MLGMTLRIFSKGQIIEYLYSLLITNGLDVQNISYLISFLLIVISFYLGYCLFSSFGQYLVVVLNICSIILLGLEFF